jgi:hypothetical protein
MQVRWPDEEKHVKGSYEFYHVKENKDYSFGTDFMVKSSLERSHKYTCKGRMIKFRTSFFGCQWCNTIIVNVHVPTKSKVAEIKNNVYEETNI